VVGEEEIRMFSEKGARAELTAEGLPIKMGVATGIRASEAVLLGRKLIKSYEPHIFMVDYVQAPRFDLRAKAGYDKLVADFAKQMKGLAVQNNIPLVLLSQFKCPDRMREPTMFDLKESGELEIISEFGLDTGELTAVLAWLGGLIGTDPTTGRIAQIIEVTEGATLAEIVLLAVYDQWANGTINGESVIPDGLLSRRDPPIYGPPYFELGLMYPAILTVAQTLALWDEASEYSLVTGSGINKWYGAAPGKTIYDDLKTQNGGLTDLQMNGILAWLPVFRDVIANKLGEDDKNLPMTPYALGETLVLSLGIGGGVLAGLGVVLLILSRRT